MAGSSDSEDRGRRRSPLADLYGDEPEERGYRSDEEAEEDGYDIPGDATSDSSARANNGADARARPPPSSVAASKNGDGSSDPVLGCDHMKVHQEAEQGIEKKNRGAKRDVPDFPSYWGVTRKREWPGAVRNASPSSAQEPDQSIVAADPEIVLETMPLPFATPNPSSATPSPSSEPMASATDNDSVESSGAQPVHNDDAVKTEVVAEEASPEGDVVHLQDAPPSPPAAGDPASPPPVQQQEQPAVAPPPRGGWQNPNGYNCNECDMWFPTYQALGGHKRKHKQYTGQSQEQPAAAPPWPRGGRQDPEGGYKCNKCDERFTTSQALGGHVAAHTKKERAAAGLEDGAGPQEAYVLCTICGEMYATAYQLVDHVRKHYTGLPVGNKPRLDLAIPQPLPPPGTVTSAPAPPWVKAEGASSSAPNPAAAGSLLGIDIKEEEEEAEQTPPAAAQQGSSAGEMEAAGSSPDTRTGE